MHYKKNCNNSRLNSSPTLIFLCKFNFEMLQIHFYICTYFHCLHQTLDYKTGRIYPEIFFVLQGNFLISSPSMWSPNTHHLRTGKVFLNLGHLEHYNRPTLHFRQLKLHSNCKLLNHKIVT